ncbi:hypothetical protein NP233_g9072 [Leucocoprinus birnbaumii]|uniref:Uncharacterized protein n=1 Tax=Leucocoprinus birnbaumii TaxID=56174 RepID=A0AAD5YR83_9AGAR|nr:hypothetical protein NP233_g9072 [Leucocoprinus birnbaumii]
MHGSGTRDSPIAIDDDSDNENVPTFGYRNHVFTPPDDLLLSPRPGTFLSNVSRPRMNAVLTRVAKQAQAEEPGLNQTRTQKRKRAPTPAQILTPKPSVKPPQQSIAPLFATQETLAPLIKPSESQKESRKQRKLRVRLERERLAQELRVKVKVKGKQKVPTPLAEPNSVHRTPLQDENAPSAKRPKHSNVPAPPLNSTSGPVPGPSTENLPPPSSASTSRGPYPPPPQTFVPALQPTIPTPPSHYLPDYAASLPLHPSVPPVFDNFMDPNFMMQIPPQYPMDFDPMFPWPFMPMGPFSTPMPMPMPPMSMPPTPMEQPPPLPNPLSSTVPSSMKPKATKNKQKSGSVQPPQRQLPKRQLILEKPFTIRVFPRRTEAWEQSLAYLPIGKPDLHFKHGIFPIVPSIMLQPPKSASSSAMSTKPISYTPDIHSTIILENVPKELCKVAWVKKWCLSATSIPPKQILLAPRRALIEFREPGDAVKAWASRRLGIDQDDLGQRVAFGAAGETLGTVAYWYRPDLGQEKGLLELWKHSKKMLPEVVSVMLVKNEAAVLAAVEAALDAIRERMAPKPPKAIKEREEGEVEESDEDENMDEIKIMGMDIDAFPQDWSALDVKGDFRKLAERLGFWVKYENAIKSGMSEDHLLVWEQQEAARIDRARSIVYAMQKAKEEKREKESVMRGMKRKLDEENEEGEVEEDETRRKRARTAASNTKIVKQTSTPIPMASTSNSTAMALSAPKPVQRVTTIEPPEATQAKPTPLTAPRKAIASVILKPPPPNLPPKPVAPQKPTIPPTPPSTTQTPVSGLVSAFGTPVSAPKTTSAFTFVSSSVIKQPRGFGLSLTMPPPVTFPPAPSHTMSASGNASMNTSAGADVGAGAGVNMLPTPPLSASLPLARTQTISQKASKETEEDVVMKDLLSSGGSDGGVDRSLIRPSSLLVAVKEKERVEDSHTSKAPLGSTPFATPSVLQTIGPVSAVSDDMDISPVSEKATDKSLPAAITSESAGLGQPLKPETLSEEAKDQSHLPPAASDAAKSSQVPKKETLPKLQVLTTVAISAEVLSVSTPVPSTIPVKAPIPVQVQTISSMALAELKKILTTPTEERQAFLDREFKATKILMDQLVATTCKKERKGITGMWKEKIRIIDEVTKSIRNDGKVWYSQETSTWMRLRWPDTPDGAGILLINEDPE